MHSVNIRQLKNNPSEALRNAADGPVLVMKGDLPQALLVRIDLEGMPDSQNLRLALAVSLFKDGALALGRAARVASTPISDFVRHLSRLGIPVAQGGRAEARSDMDTLDEWLASS